MKQSDIPVNQPLNALVSWLQQEVWAEPREEERDSGVQLLVDLFGLDAALQRHGGGAEQGVMELQESWLDSQQLLQPRAAWKRAENREVVRRENRKRLRVWLRFGLTEGVESAPVHGGSIFGIKEQRGDIFTTQQVGIALRQREPLQLESQGRHDGFWSEGDKNHNHSHS